MSNIVLAKESYQNDYNKDCESRNDSSSELDDIIATKHGSSSDNVTGQLQLGLTLTALNEMVGKIIEVTWYWIPSNHNSTRNPYTIIGKNTF